MQVRKAVITAAGRGTRFLPATKAQSKELFPILNKPVIQYAVDEASAAGIEQVIVVIAPGNHAVEDYFQRDSELEKVLEASGKLDLLHEVRSLRGCTIMQFVVQQEPRGLGNAVLTAKDAVGDEPFVLLLPDDLIQSRVPVTRQLIDVFENRREMVIAVEEVPPGRVADDGIIPGHWLDNSLCRILGVIEKPGPQQAPSTTGIVGRYVLTPDVFPVLEKTDIGKNGEIQLTDAIATLLKSRPAFGYRFEGKRHDVGTPLGLLKAAIAVAMDDPTSEPDMTHYIRGLLQGR